MKIQQEIQQILDKYQVRSNNPVVLKAELFSLVEKYKAGEPNLQYIPKDSKDFLNANRTRNTTKKRRDT